MVITLIVVAFVSFGLGAFSWSLLDASAIALFKAERDQVRADLAAAHAFIERWQAMLDAKEAKLKGLL